VDRLSAYDRSICRAFSYKVQTHTTDASFEKLPYAFPSDPPLPKIDALRSRVAFLAGFKPQVYDCCPKSCCCYVGPHQDLLQCPYCGEARLRPDGKPRNRFTYIPLIPRLIAFAGNRSVATDMQYRGRTHKHTPGVSTDTFDGTNYRSLREQNVVLHTEVYEHKYFEDQRDVALGLSTDGFSPFKRRKKTAWPLIIFNYNLPPEIRFHLENILALGIIPGKPIDADSYLWPLVQELFRLAIGVRAFDILTSSLFPLRAFLITVFGDIPALAMIMRMKGHNAISPCRMCEIIGLRIPNSGATTHYVPLDRSRHPDVRVSEDAVRKYMPNNLPTRDHDKFLAQANEIQLALTCADAKRLAMKYGIKGISILSYLPSLRFPSSFPYDFMHLIWENLITNLILLWTGEFKGLDSGTESYELPRAIWESIGQATATSGSTIPSAYGTRVPNIAQNRSNCSAEMWSFWTLYLGPVLLQRRFQRPKYYTHFVSLVRLLNICLQFEITDDEIEELRVGFAEWVIEYEK
jgi:Transposase family tnp2